MAQIVAAALIAPSAAPLYIATFAGAADDEALKLRLHTILHTALDAIDERAAARPASSDGNTAADAYLGLLHSVDDFKVYGYTSMSRVRFLLLVSDPANRPESVQELRAIFRRMQAAYVDACSNPFYSPGTPIVSQRFDASIRTIAQSLGAMT